MNENRPTRRSDILVEGSLDETMLYHPDSDELHVLNPTAQFIWTLCDGDHSLDQMVDALRTHFAVSPDSDIQWDRFIAPNKYTFGRPSPKPKELLVPLVISHSE